MRWSFPLFRIFGISVHMHWLMLIVMGFYFAQAGTADGWTGVWMMGVTQLILLVSILFHELGHCWMVIRHRGSAEKILIWPLGGLSFVEYDRGPHQQIQVSGIGPLSSLLLSAIFFGVLVATGIPWRWDWALPFEHWTPRKFSLLQIFLLHAARLNLLLAVFNLVIPAYPLDGGQVLFGLLTLRYGRLRAAKTMAAISIPVGVAIAFFALASGMIMLALIGLSVIYEGHQLRMLIRSGDIDAHPGYASGSGPQFDYMPDRPRRKGFFARWREKRARDAIARDEERDRVSRDRVDEVLDKVSREGIGSLTLEERKILDDASRRGRGDS